MNNAISIALDSATALFGATESTQWQVTFVNRDSKRGSLEHVVDDVFMLTSGRQVFYFRESQVVHITPFLPR